METDGRKWPDIHRMLPFETKDSIIAYIMYKMNDQNEYYYYFIDYMHGSSFLTSRTAFFFKQLDRTQAMYDARRCILPPMVKLTDLSRARFRSLKPGAHDSS